MSGVFFVASLCLPLLAFLGVVVTSVAQGGVSKQQTIVFKPQSFFQFGKNVREIMPSQEELRALATSYKQRWLMPCIAMSTGLLIDGYCRLAGLKLVDPDWLVPTIITEEHLKPAQITRLQMVSAIQRNSLSAADISKGIQEMVKDDPTLTNQGISDALGFADSSLVTRYVAWRKCIEPIQRAYFAGDLKVSKVYEASHLDPATQLELWKANMLNGSRSALKAHISKSKATANGTTKPKRKPRPKPVQVPVRTGTLSLSGLEAMTPAEVAILLHEVADAALEAAHKGDTLEGWITKMRDKQWLDTLPTAELALVDDGQANPTA